jgi:chloramphenicol-sensitive protein RarD
MPAARLAGFGLVWCALVIFTWDALRTASAARRATATETPAEELAGVNRS